MATNANSILVAGATGALGGIVTRELLNRGARVRALVRHNSPSGVVLKLREWGATTFEVNYKTGEGLAQACEGAACVVSALSGLREVMVDAQTALLQAAVATGVPRFIPSDFAIDFTKLTPGSNRNLDLRLEFKKRLDEAPIAATSILNGMFTDLLTGQAPVVLYPLHRVLYWGDADQPLDFTTMNDTAVYTAAAALDTATPRFLRIAGDVCSARDLASVASEATGKKFRLLRLGGLGGLDTLIKVTRTLMPANDDVFPPWQGMQYLRNMFSGEAKLSPLDNDRYPGLQWTKVREVLRNR